MKRRPAAVSPPGQRGPKPADTASSGSTYHGAGGATYAHGAAGYGAGHTALPTDAGYGMPAARTGTTAYAGYHQTEAVSGSVYAARGASVRTTYSDPGLYGRDWYAANPGAWAPAGWTAGQAWTAATWPAVGVSLGWGGIQPVSYNYGTNITYQDNEVYYGNQPVATADDYYQQASTLAQARPRRRQSGRLAPAGRLRTGPERAVRPALRHEPGDQQVGRYRRKLFGLVSGTTVPIQGAVDKKTQRAAWTVGKNKKTVCETGLYNLTKDEAPALIHMGKDKTQQWLLVRLKQHHETGTPDRNMGSRKIRKEYRGKEYGLIFFSSLCTRTGMFLSFIFLSSIFLYEMNRLLTLTAVIEAATGLALIAVPAVVVRLLLGSEISGAGIPLGRVAGFGLLSLGVACWPSRDAPARRARPAGDAGLQFAGDALSPRPWNRRGMGRAALVAGRGLARRSVIPACANARLGNTGKIG